MAAAGYSGTWVMSSPVAPKGIEELTPVQRACVEEYLAITQAEGVVTGVLVGSEPWDIRPLVLEGGRLEMIRFLSPDRAREFDAMSPAVRTLEKVLSDFPAAFQPARIFQSANRIWIRRQFTPHTLAEMIDPFSPQPLEIKASAIHMFLDTLRRVYQAGLVHGHISLANIGFSRSGLLIPLDCGLHSLPGGASEGLPAAEELKSLEQIFSNLKFSGCSPALVVDLMSIGSRQGSAVAVLNEVLGSFSVTETVSLDQVDATISEGQVPPVAVAPRGRIIEARVAGRGVTQNNLTEAPAPQARQRRRSSVNLKLPNIDVSKHREQLKEVSGKFADRRTTIMIAGVLIGFLGLAGTVTRGFGFFAPRNRAPEFQRMWSSNQSELQAEVVAEALADPFSPAIDIIRKDVMSGKKHPGVRSEIIRVAFDPQWYPALSAQDRRTVLSIALGELVPPEKRQIASFGQLHPGVLLALAGMVNLDHPGEMFSGISLERFAKLPPPVSLVFKQFIEGGIKELRSLAPRAYAHLYMGDGNREVFERYLISSSDIEFTREQLRLIQPLLEKNPTYAKPLADLLANSGLSLAAQFDWFDEDQTANWAEATPLARLLLLGGKLPPTDLTLEQYIDLLQFPVESVREDAQAVLTKRYVSENYRSLLLVLSSPENKLTRGQMIFLVSALQLPDDEAFAFFSRWFSAEPDPDTVFLILLSRSRTRKAAPFDMGAARYLIDRQWSSSTDELAELVQHPEPLARALAYSRLEPKKPEDLKVLKEQMEKESSDRLRQQVREKLTGF